MKRPAGPPRPQEPPWHPAHAQLVSRVDAAKILGLSTKTVRRYIAAGDLDKVPDSQGNNHDEVIVAVP